MVKIFGTQTIYYHWTTFLQLNTFWFLLHFPNPLILSELLGSGRNDSKFMFEFLFEDILPVIACRRFWTDLFAICGNTPSRRIQSPTTHYQKMSCHVRVKPKQRRVLHIYGVENENSCGGNELCSSILEGHRVPITLLWCLSGLVYSI